MRRGGWLAAWLWVAAGCLGGPGTAAAQESPRRLRLSAGPAVALDPAFGSVGLGADWFVAPSCALGIAVAQTIPRAGDPRAIEDSYGFASALFRYRPRTEARLKLDLLAGAGLARIRFGRPGAHTEYAPDLVAGIGVGLPLGRQWELAAELATHVTFGNRTGTRNPPHTSDLLSLAVRWGGPGVAPSP